jgi:hypothetical protein
VRNLLANDAVRPNCCACYYTATFGVFGVPVGPVERSVFFCRTYSLVMRVIRGEHVNVLVVCNEPCVIGPLSLVRPIGHSGCPGIGEITEPAWPLSSAAADGANSVLLLGQRCPRDRAGLARRILAPGGYRILRANLWAPRPRGRRVADARSAPARARRSAPVPGPLPSRHRPGCRRGTGRAAAAARGLDPAGAQP